MENMEHVEITKAEYERLTRIEKIVVHFEHTENQP